MKTTAEVVSRSAQRVQHTLAAAPAAQAIRRRALVSRCPRATPALRACKLFVISGRTRRASIPAIHGSNAIWDLLNRLRP
jgi:hypothetical protein